MAEESPGSVSNRLSFIIRRATERDAAGIVAILQWIASERIFSAVDKPWSVEQEHGYLKSLSSREAVYVGVAASGKIIGFQSLDLWAPTLHSMAHVAQLGTFILPEWRRRGVGSALFERAVGFARESGYRKIVILVRASNSPAQVFYEHLGFRACGRLTRQVRIEEQEDDEILMELFL